MKGILNISNGYVIDETGYKRDVEIRGKKIVSMNLNSELYHKAKVFAATNETTVTAVLEDLLKHHLECKRN